MSIFLITLALFWGLLGSWWLALPFVIMGCLVVGAGAQAVINKHRG